MIKERKTTHLEEPMDLLVYWYLQFHRYPSSRYDLRLPVACAGLSEILAFLFTTFITITVAVIDITATIISMSRFLFLIITIWVVFRRICLVNFLQWSCRTVRCFRFRI